MNEQETAAKRTALSNILVRNHDVLQWYIAKMFEHMPPMYSKVMFKAFSLIDKEGKITQDTLWMLIPAFISSLPSEHFAVFLDHMGGFADCLHNEYQQYCTQSRTDDTTITAEAIEPVPVSGDASDDYRSNWQRQIDVQQCASTDSTNGALSTSDTGHER